MSLCGFVKDLVVPGFAIAKYALGKYIIAAASFLHLLWALVICLDSRAIDATPILVLFVACDFSISKLVILLVLVSFGGLAFLNFRLRRAISKASLTFLLVPQQIVLIASAGAGIHAAITQQYADGTFMAWSHIFVDQAPILVIALLYSVALIESLKPPKFHRVLP